MEDASIEELKKEIEDLKDKIERLQREQIVVVGNFDGTNIPITIQGIRRKIATTTP